MQRPPDSTGSVNDYGGGSDNPSGNWGAGGESWENSNGQGTGGYGDASKQQGGGIPTDYKSDDIGSSFGENQRPPAQTAISTNMLSLWSPTEAQLIRLSNFLWSDEFLENLKKIQQSPMEAIVSLSMLPFAPPTGGTANVMLGNVDTAISMAHISNQFVTIDFGYIDINEYWKTYLDYSPYTTVSIYLPYLGTFELDADDVMNSRLYLNYNVDLLTGNCAAQITVARGQVFAILYQYTGNIACGVPVTASDHSAQIQALLSGAVATGGSLITGNVGAIAATAASSAVGVATAKSHILHGSSMQANSGVLGVQDAYVTISRPVQSMPGTFAREKGFASNISAYLYELNGYTEVEYIHLEGFNTATADELTEIENLLKAGVIL